MDKNTKDNLRIGFLAVLVIFWGVVAWGFVSGNQQITCFDCNYNLGNCVEKHNELIEILNNRFGGLFDDTGFNATNITWSGGNG